MIDRRMVLGAVAGSGVTAVAAVASSRLGDMRSGPGDAETADMVECASAFRKAYNSGATAGFFDRYAASGFGLHLFGDAQHGAAAERSLASVRDDLGPLGSDLSAGNYLRSPDDNILLYQSTMTGGSGAAERAGPDVFRPTILLAFTFATAGPADGIRLERLEFGSDGANGETVSVRDAGAQGDGRADDSAAIQAAYDALATRGGGTLFFPPGLYRLSLRMTARNVHVRGAGPGATRLVPPAKSAIVLNALYRDASWQYVTISDLDIVGVDGGGTGFQAGADRYVAGDEYAGRTRLSNIHFRDLDRCVARPHGQIGLTIEDCTFGGAEFHIWGRSHPESPGDRMHNGNLVVRHCHMDGARKAVFFVDGPETGTGQIIFDGCIMEANPGFVFFANNINSADSVPGMLAKNCWNEANGANPATVIEGQSHPTRYARFRNSSFVRFDDTPIGSLSLVNSVVVTENCALDQLRGLDLDANSTIEHFRARGFGSYVPLGRVNSVAAAYQSDPPGRALTFSMPHRTALTVAERPHALLRNACLAPIRFTGSAARETVTVADGVLPNATTAQELIVGPGESLFPPAVDMPPESWLVWIHAYRLVSGPPVGFSVTGGRGVSVDRPLDSSSWETLVGMAHTGPGGNDISLWHNGGAARSVVRIGGYNLLAFATRQRALDFINGNMFVA